MRPNELVVRNYRSFAGEHRIELRPLTLLFGDNSAGKSALARALPLLADATDPYAEGPLPLNSRTLAGCGFADLCFKGQLHDDDGAHLGLGLGWGPECSVRSALFEFTREYKRIQVRRLTLDTNDGEHHELEWIPRDDPTAYFQSREQELALRFDGLVPKLVRPEGPASTPDIHAAAVQLRALHRKVQWIQATRAVPARRNSQPPQPFSLIEPDGSDAARLVFVDDPVRKQVSSWFEHNLEQELIAREVPPDEFKIMLRRVSDPPYDVDLIDAGQGAVQVFPVLVALAALDSEKGPYFLVVEEPESHLHPELQYELAREFAKSACDTSHSIIIETHSRPFFLGVQLELIEGRLDPEDVIVYSVRQDPNTGRSHIDRVELDHDGTPSHRWPPDFFSADARLARRVMAARQARRSAP